MTLRAKRWPKMRKPIADDGRVVYTVIRNENETFHGDVWRSKVLCAGGRSSTLKASGYSLNCPQDERAQSRFFTRPERVLESKNINVSPVLTRNSFNWPSPNSAPSPVFRVNIQVWINTRKVRTLWPGGRVHVYHSTAEIRKKTL